MATWLAAAAAATLSACASFAPLPAPGAGDSFSGRLSMRVAAHDREPERAFSAAFDLRGDAGRGTLALSTPLGSTLAQAQWTASEVVLVTPQGRRRFDDLDALTREVLGESVPVAAWFDWLRGKPWANAAAAADAPASSVEPSRGFRQLGWAVDLSRFADGRVVAARSEPAPAVTVRIQLDAS